MTDPLGAEDLLAAVDGSAYPLSNDEVVFRTRSADEKHVMTLDVLRAMDTCSRFRTFEEHVRHVTRRQGKLQGQEAAVRQVLEAAVKRGLFISAREWLPAGETGGPTADDTPAPVFIRSAGRETQLRALLESAGELESGAGRRHRYIVVEDGGTAGARAACRQVVEQATDRGLDCHMLDLDWQRDFTRRVMDGAGLGDDPAVQWALLGGPGEPEGSGRVRNFVQLAAAGMPHLMLDDDRICLARRDPSARMGVELDDGTWSLWFHPDAEAARAWGVDAGIDPLEEHFAALGLSCADALRRFAREPGDLAGLDFRAVERMAPGDVLATQSGMHGDDGRAGNIGHYLAQGPSLERLQGDENAYRQLRMTRYLSRSRDSHALQSVGASSPIGVANDRALPPALPTDGDEGPFRATLLHALYPRSRFLEFPWALGQFPAGNGEIEPAWEAPFTGDLSRFLAGEVGQLASQVPEVTGEARFTALAERLAALSACPDGRLLDKVAEFQVRMRIHWIHRLNDVRRNVSRPSIQWERDIKAIIRVNARSLESGVPRRVAGMPGRLDDASAAAWLRERIDPMAGALAAWPGLWRASAALQSLKPLGVVTP